jgi:hypothetical protein
MGKHWIHEGKESVRRSQEKTRQEGASQFAFLTRYYQGNETKQSEMVKHVARIMGMKNSCRKLCLDAYYINNI